MTPTLTAAQNAAIKADVIAAADAEMQALEADPTNPDKAQAVANLYNAQASPAYSVWRTSIPKQELDGLIDKQAFTMVDNPPAASGNTQGTNDALLYNNRALATQLKQTNAQWLIIGQGAINASIGSVRKNFQDCLRQIPSGSAGALQDGGWGAPASPGVVRLAMLRSATRIEKLFAFAGSGVGNNGADPRGSATNPDLLGPEGEITYGEVLEAMK